MKFKVGDKVVIVVVDPHCKDYKGEIGKITEIDRIARNLSNRWDYAVRFDDGFHYPFSSEEIKRMPNQQLLFDFMEC